MMSSLSNSGYGDGNGSMIMANSDEDYEEIQKRVREIVDKWMSRIEKGDGSDDCRLSPKKRFA